MNEYYEYFGPDYELDVKSSNMDDMNSPEYLDRVKNIVLEHLRHVGGPPSVQMTGLCALNLIWSRVILNHTRRCPAWTYGRDGRGRPR